MAAVECVVLPAGRSFGPGMSPARAAGDRFARVAGVAARTFLVDRN
jgi:hypothetical protein